MKLPQQVHSTSAFIKGLGVRGMTTVDELSLSPASDCNSNNVDASYTSTTSDAEFIQDNCDYQWFPDYGYREFQHKSVLSSCYDELARDLDTQLAHVDMEDYSAQDILSTLPAMCCTDIQPERHGEMFASVSGSLMVKYEFDSSISPHNSSQDESSMSLCQSEPLFSPVKEAPLFPPNYSVDSLDCEDQDHLIVTCQANKHNYTIAFHGSTLLEDNDLNPNENKESKKDKMTTSDAPTTTWSKLRKIPPRHRNRSKTISLPDLAPPELSASYALGQCMKLYDIQNSSSTSESFSGSGDSGPRKQGNFSLLRMFIAQRNQIEHLVDNTRNKKVRNANEMTDTAWMDDLSACYEDSLVKENNEDAESSSVERISSKSASICSCSLSASLNKFNVNNNNSYEKEGNKRHNVRVGTSGSELSEPTSSTDQTKVACVERKCPIHCIDRSMQTSCVRPQSEFKLKEPLKKDPKKPVYVLYPNYTLPDLGFLRKNSLDLDQVLLTPVKFGNGTSPQTPPVSQIPCRTITKHDIELLKKKGLSHIMDWTSLTPLLPSEYWSILAELPQIKQHSNTRFENTKPNFCMTPTKEAPFPDGKTISSESSTNTAPSSGYRGSSTLLNESVGTTNPLYVYNYSEEKVKPRRKANIDPVEKRYSMFELGGMDEIMNEQIEGSKKRKSFPAHHFNKEYSDMEAWDEWWKDSKQRPNSPPSTHANRLNKLIELSNHEQWQPHDIHVLRDQVSKFLSEVGRKCVSFADKASADQQLTPPNSPTCQKNYQGKPNLTDYLSPESKKTLIDGIAEAVDKVLNYTDENVSQIVLDTLCPAMYAFLSDGLKSQLDTPFGPISNSVWQVIEASAQQGPMTRALNELVMKLNSEDVLSEGVIKFNAFVFGLLNVRGMDAWISYIRTRESILSKHYQEDSILLAASKGNAKSRGLTDSLISILKPLALSHFCLDMLYETRQLHESLLQFAKMPVSPSLNLDLASESILLRRIVQSIRSGLGNYSSTEYSHTSDSKPARPRSCVDNVETGTDLASAANKRWSGVQSGSKLATAFGRLQAEEEFPDSLEAGKSSGEEAEPLENDDGKDRRGTFRSLQRKWELLSGQENLTDLSPVKTSCTTPKSRIPRPVTSPIRPQSRLPTLVNQRRISTPNSARAKVDTGKSKIQRPSRVDLPPDTKTTSRPSSLPYRPPGNATKVQRRAASSSTVRKPTLTGNSNNQNKTSRHVVTLAHRMPADSGHLAFNEGERLRLVLEVDDTWLLCCRGDQKGLVPRSAVI